MNDLIVHVAQMNSVDDVSTNLRQVDQLIERALQERRAQFPDARSSILFLPENSLFFRIKEGAPIHAFDLREEFWASWSDRLRDTGLSLHFGSVPFREGDGKATNSSVWLSPGGKPERTYAKIHLFDIELEGQKPIRESDAFHHGTRARVLEAGGWRLGQSICYDLRFAPLYAKYAELQVDAILVPSAFLVKTGEAHWHTLLRARAIESQCYVLAAAQGGEHISPLTQDRRHTFGHALIVDPWGEVQGDAGPTGISLLTARLENQKIQKVRRQIPMRDHRRDIGG